MLARSIRRGFDLVLALSGQASTRPPPLACHSLVGLRCHHSPRVPLLTPPSSLRPLLTPPSSLRLLLTRSPTQVPILRAAEQQAGGPGERGQEDRLLLVDARAQAHQLGVPAQRVHDAVHGADAGGGVPPL